MEADALCDMFPEILNVIEVSAKDNTNVDTTFAQLATELKVCQFFFWVEAWNILLK